MNPHTHLNQDQLTLLYFDEAGDPERQHLAQCTICRASYDGLAQFLNVLHAAPVPEKDPAWEQELWAKLSPRVTEILRPKRFQLWPWVFAPWVSKSWVSKSWVSKSWVSKSWVLGPALAALLVATFFIGRYTKTAPPLVASSQARDRVLLITLGDHLDRSQIVLAELVNAPEGKPLNIAAEQQLAGNLVGENRLLRQIVSSKGDRSDSAVLDELERVLLDIAHSPSEVSPDELENLRQRIEAQGLLFKVRVVSTNVREKGMKL